MYSFKEKKTAAQVDRITSGEAFIMDWGQYPPALGRKALQLLWTRLGGFQVNNFDLSEPRKPQGPAGERPLMSADDIERACNFITAHGPRTTANCTAPLDF